MDEEARKQVVLGPFRLTVLTPAEALLDVEGVAWVQARLVDGGGIGIYPGHAPLLAETVTAPLRYADPLGEHTLDLEAGILQVDGGRVTILTSGLHHARAGSPRSQRPEAGAEEIRFDRLARALLTAVQVQPEGILGGVEGDE